MARQTSEWKLRIQLYDIFAARYELCRRCSPYLRNTLLPLDNHSPETFENRVKNFIVGGKAVALTAPEEVAIGREQTLGKLSEILGRPGANRIIGAMGRASKLDEAQVAKMLEWLSGIKAAT